MAIRADLFADWQKEFLPVHVCRTNFCGYSDDEELPSPPEGMARVLCPNKKCKMALFIQEQARWVEYKRIPDGKHPFDKCPPKSYKPTSTCVAWWKRRCENCGRFGHTAAQCDQRIVAIRYIFCNCFSHEVSDCQMAAAYQMATQLALEQLGKNGQERITRIDNGMKRIGNDMSSGGRNQFGQMDNGNERIDNDMNSGGRTRFGQMGNDNRQRQQNPNDRPMPKKAVQNRQKEFGEPIMGTGTTNFDKNQQKRHSINTSIQVAQKKPRYDRQFPNDSRFTPDAGSSQSSSLQSMANNNGPNNLNNRVARMNSSAKTSKHLVDTKKRNSQITKAQTMSNVVKTIHLERCRSEKMFEHLLSLMDGGEESEQDDQQQQQESNNAVNQAEHRSSNYYENEYSAGFNLSDSAYEQVDRTKNCS